MSMKKKITINFVDFAKDFDNKNNDFVRILSNWFEVVISEHPDYLFYSNFGYKHTKYNCIKIYFTGENTVPDFNLCDYAIGFSEMTFNDRYLRYPLYKLFQYRKDLELALSKDNIYKTTKKDLFCSFVVSNDNGMKEREAFFKQLCKYKTVSSGGRYLNNIGGPVKDKLEFQSKHKFSIAFENTSSAGYTTEKIVQAFASGSIPIYFGNPNISKEFNENSFINCHHYNNFEEVINRIKEIDNDDVLYNKIISEKITNCDLLSEKELEEFLLHIFSQDLDKAKRIVINSQTIEEKQKEKIYARKYPFILFKKRIRGFFRRFKHKSL